MKIIDNPFWHLKLARSKNIGAVTYRLLLQQYGNPKNAIDNISDKLKTQNDNEIYEEINYVHSFNGGFIDGNIHKSPASIITIIGDVKCLENPLLGIIGTRYPSILGIKTTTQIIKDLNGKYIITSGLALGIDTISHESSIKTGTVAVLPSGIMYPYPPQNNQLYKRICNTPNCAVISQFKYNENIKNYTFLQRNQLLASICKGLLLIEANDNSGTLFTVRDGLKRKKICMVIPGHPLDDRYGGNIKVLKEGGIPVCNSDDIITYMEQLNPVMEELEIENIPIDLSTSNEKLRNNILNYLSYNAISIYDISHYLNISISQTLSCCIDLNLSGQIEISIDLKVNRIS